MLCCYVIIFVSDKYRGVARGRGACPQSSLPPIVYWVDFLTGKMALLGRRACFSKVTLFSLPEVSCGLPQSSSFEGDEKEKRSTFSERKCTLAASVPPAPNVKSWLRAWINIVRAVTRSCCCCDRPVAGAVVVGVLLLAYYCISREQLNR